VTGIHQSIAAGALVLALVAGTSVEWQSERAAPNARFWFEGVTFDIPRPTPFIPTPITTEEARRIERVARAELTEAFAPFRLTVSEQPRARYQVRVIQQFPPRTGPQRLAAAESIALGPLGGYGWVSFATVTSLAVGHAPGGADRASVIDSIGRGIGRVAAHEFAHQILTGADLHRSRDPESYEFASADRATQFYGRMAWDFAAPLLSEKLSPARE
jgi:hypothetical protein